MTRSYEREVHYRVFFNRVEDTRNFHSAGPRSEESRLHDDERESYDVYRNRQKVQFEEMNERLGRAAKCLPKPNNSGRPAIGKVCSTLARQTWYDSKGTIGGGAVEELWLQKLKGIVNGVEGIYPGSL